MNKILVEKKHTYKLFSKVSEASYFIQEFIYFCVTNHALLKLFIQIQSYLYFVYMGIF